ncbi:methyltransferase family protein [Marinospirillum perlucidum]|uniref:methyltransferase family protein n=1 Tax=Marinospirillum perlucidum TaxID=1982602 RepID=UPI000DF26EDC|nr:isoprenylcysteine carboxylmethyltransferase family protein [Marinospirillum perlucidum]
MTFLEKRIPPLLVTAFFILLLGLLDQVTPEFAVYNLVRWLVAGLLLALGGYFALAGVLCFRRAQTTFDPCNPEKTSCLVTTGVYRITRNPMYLGFACILAAWGVYLASPWLLLVLPLFLVYIHRFQIQPEERLLQTRFSEEFQAYRERVPPWL